MVELQLGGEFLMVAALWGACLNFENPVGQCRAAMVAAQLWLPPPQLSAMVAEAQGRRVGEGGWGGLGVRRGEGPRFLRAAAAARC